MREYIVEASSDGRRLDRWLAAMLPGAAPGQVQKLLREKRVRRNGAVAKADCRLSAGDVMKLFIADQYFEKPDRPDPFYSRIQPRLNLLYEGPDVLLLDKPAGLLCHPDEHEKVRTLVTELRAWLYQRGEWSPGDAFAPALANRIDRFTRGIVLAARTQRGLDALERAIRDRLIDKRYLLVVHGAPKPAEGTLRHCLVKRGNRVEAVRASDQGQKAETKYRTLAVRGDLALLECALVTGRMHQIRAQMAAIGHPLLGDNQYGDPRFNRKYGESQQLLCSWRVAFPASLGDAPALSDVAGKSFRVRRVPFVEKYFPEVGLESLE